MLLHSRNIKLSCFITEGNPFLSLKIPCLTLFKFKHEEYGSYIYKRFLKDLEERGIAAVPRRNKLYFSGRKDLLLEMIAYHNLAERIGLEYEHTHNYEEISLSNPADMEILKMITYSLIRQYLRNTTNRNIKFFGSGLNVIVREAPRESQRRILESIIRRVKSSVDTFLEDIKIYYGLVFQLEIDKNGRGRLWFDLVTKVLRIGSEVRSRDREWLSRKELKKLDYSLSKLYRELAQPSSDERLNTKIGLLNELGLRDGFSVVIMNHEGRVLREARFVPLI